MNIYRFDREEKISNRSSFWLRREPRVSKNLLVFLFIIGLEVFLGYLLAIQKIPFIPHYRELSPKVIFILTGLFIGALTTFIIPETLYLIGILMIITIRTKVFGPVLFGHLWVFVVFLGLIFRTTKKFSSYRLFIPWLDVPLALLLTWAILSLMWTPDLHDGIFSYSVGSTGAIYYLTCPLFYLISILLINNETTINRVMWAWLIAGVTSVLIMPSELVADKNRFSYILNFSFFLGLGVFMRIPWSSLFRKITALLFIALNLSLQLFTQSRGALLGLFVGVISYAFLSQLNLLREGKISFRFILSLCLPLVAILLIFNRSLLMQHSEYLGHYKGLVAPEKEPSLFFRLTIWEISLQMIADQGAYLWGLGIGAFKAIGQAYGVGYGYAKHPHNIFLNLILHFGIISLPILLLFLIALFHHLHLALKKSHSTPLEKILWGFYSGLIAYLTHGMVDLDFFRWEFWLFLGFGIATIKFVLSKQKPL